MAGDSQKYLKIGILGINFDIKDGGCYNHFLIKIIINFTGSILMSDQPKLELVPSFDETANADFANLFAAHAASTPDWPEPLDRFVSQGAAHVLDVLTRLHKQGGKSRELAADVLAFLVENPTEGIKIKGNVTEWGPLRVNPQTHKLFELMTASAEMVSQPGIRHGMKNVETEYQTPRQQIPDGAGDADLPHVNYSAA
jgi:hypothetical protein